MSRTPAMTTERRLRSYHARGYMCPVARAGGPVALTPAQQRRLDCKQLRMHGKEGKISAPKPSGGLAGLIEMWEAKRKAPGRD
jgi:hypothetical protein